MREKLEMGQRQSYRPFCSERCKMIDLGEWATEAYRIPSPKTKTCLKPEIPRATARKRQ